jgi:putative resolvase
VLISGHEDECRCPFTGVSDRTAWRWFKAGKVAGFQADTGTLIVTEPIVEAVPATANPKTVIDTCLSAAENQDHLEGQAKGQKDSCAAKGYPVAAVVQEIGSGVNDPRPKRLKWLTDSTVGPIGVEPKDRLTRFGFNSIEPWLAMQGRKMEVIHLAENGKEDLTQDAVSMVTSFCARL